MTGLRNGNKWTNRAAAAMLVAQTVTAALPAGAQAPPPDSLRTHVAVLAADSLGGRGAGSDGYGAAGAYAARILGRAGVRPVGDDGAGGRSFFQQFVARRNDTAPVHESFNVIGMIEGTDARLRGEYVAIGAHLDGLGVRDGQIYNGANDNATGSATVLELARALAARPPRRSVLVGLWGAEERGLLGSRSFVDGPAVPLDRIVALLNFDGIGRFDRSPADTVGMYALGADSICPALGASLREVNARTARLMLLTGDPHGWFRASDHFPFHQHGVPVVFLTDMGSDDYHRPTDDVDAIDAVKLARTAWLGLALVRELADHDRRVCPMSPLALPGRDR